MKANILYYRVSEQKSPSGKVLGWNILGGFDAGLTFKTATYKGTALDTLTTAQLEVVVSRMAERVSARAIQHVSCPGMLKKLARNDDAHKMSI